jgi:hypothetical protein
MPRRSGQVAETDAVEGEPVTYRRALGGAPGPPSDLALRFAALEARVDALEERFHETLANLTITVVDGYVVRVWPDLETGQWVADCAAVGASVQQATREEALAAIRVMVAEAVAALKDWGETPPPREV